MDGRTYLANLVEAAGGLPEAADKWGIPYPSLAHVLNGTRGCSRRMAFRIVEGTSGRADPGLLMMIAATKGPAPEQGERAEAA